MCDIHCRFSPQPSWVSTHWSPVAKRTLELQVKTVTTVSWIHDLSDGVCASLCIASEGHRLVVFLSVFPRCHQRGADVPRVRRTPEPDQCGRDTAEDKKQRRLFNGGQPQQHQGTQRCAAGSVELLKAKPDADCVREAMCRLSPSCSTKVSAAIYLAEHSNPYSEGHGQSHGEEHAC